MSVAVVFSGQGAQHPDMLPWLADDPILRAMSARLGTEDWRAALRDPAWAAGNRHAQLVLAGTALAAWAQLAPSLPAPLAVAGYSVGELAAFCAAGVFEADVALALAAERAAAMDRAAAAAPGSLMGVTGIGREALAAACAAHGLELAIRNGEHAVVVAGTARALEEAEATLAAQGARCTRLRVGVRSHTSAMRPATAAFAAVLSTLPMARPRVALVADATGERCVDAGQARHALAAQVSSTVLWSDCMDALRARRPRCVLEIGPGQALARLWNDRHPDVPARSCDEFRSAQAVAGWVRRGGS
jgi:[acyl-carrier-protein] S-malonyltransferase